MNSETVAKQLITKQRTQLVMGKVSYGTRAKVYRSKPMTIDLTIITYTL